MRRVIAQDILTDFNACYTRNAPGAARVLIQQAAHLPGDVVDIVLNRARRHSLLVDWGIGNAQRVFGVQRPSQVLAAVRSLRTDEVPRSSRRTCCSWPAPRTTTCRCVNSATS